jgi:hypothetical protein
VQQVAFAEPDAGRDLFDSVRLGVAARKQEGEAQQDGESGNEE